MKKFPVYLDYNATTPIDKEVGQEMIPYITEYFGNPSSSHIYGQITKKACEKARQQIASLLNCKDEEIIFTSGGTESNNYAIKGICHYYKNKGNHIITSKIEHPAVLEVCKYLETQGFIVTYLGVDQYGLISIQDLLDSINEKTILITIMHANNEVGTIQPIEEIGKIAREKTIFFHTDASQSIGKIQTNVEKLNVDLLTVCSHKLYGPKGVGALYVRKGVKLEKFMHGANHEKDQRAGTENVIEIVGLGKSCEIIERDFEKNYKNMKETADYLYEIMKNELGDKVSLNGHLEKRLPNTLSLSFIGFKSNEILDKIKEEVAASAGSACHSGHVTISKVLEEMKIPYERATGTLRISTGKYTSREDIEQAAKAILKIVKN